MRVRPARPGDAEALRAAVSRAHEATVFDDIGAPIFDVSAAGVREAAATADCCYLAELDGQPIGLAIAHPDGDEREAELLALWVHPEHVGADVTERLLERVAAALAERGVERLRASIETELPSAREFYRAQGFSHRGEQVIGSGTETILVAPISAFK